MFREHLTDLDELILRCRSERAKVYIAEAVNCYRAGAFRACIVSTWIAVVFDFIDKIHELELAEDKPAKEVTEKLEKIQQQNDFVGSQKFEQDVLVLARDKFELLSPIEYEDLKRLHEDRNRCAHPSMRSLDEPYQPSGELARYHLRNAVLYLLQQPPVQGKAALDRIWGEIKSEYFPVDPNKAVEHFEQGPLGRAREPLKRGVILGLTKSLLLKHLSPLERARQFSALNAVLKMYVETGEKILDENLPKIVQSAGDTELPNVIEYVRHIRFAWDALGKPGKIKASRFIETSLPENVAFAIRNALYIPALKEIAIKRIQDLPIDTLAEQIRLEPNREYASVVMQHLEKARSFYEANMLIEALLPPLVPILTIEDIRLLVKVIIKNSQVYDSVAIRSVLEEIFTQHKQHAKELKNEWMQVYTKRELGEWGTGGKIPLRSTLYKDLPLRHMIEETFPEVLSLTELDDD